MRSLIPYAFSYTICVLLLFPQGGSFHTIVPFLMIVVSYSKRTRERILYSKGSFHTIVPFLMISPFGRTWKQKENAFYIVREHILESKMGEMRRLKENAFYIVREQILESKRGDSEDIVRELILYGQRTYSRVIPQQISSFPKQLSGVVQGLRRFRLN